jgi:NMD protein affecting ribosome stability and mRNA decay
VVGVLRQLWRWSRGPWCSRCGQERVWLDGLCQACTFAAVMRATREMYGVARCKRCGRVDGG